MRNIDEILSKLNSEQIKPVKDTEGAVLVIAGAGSGKTRVLTSRIAYLILEKGVSPSNIMAITFTNKAAGEMKERLAALVGDVGEMWVSTIHSMCVRILRSCIDRLGYDKNFTIYDETDKEKTFKRIFDALGLDKDKLLKTCINLISTAKNDCISPENFSENYSQLKSVEDIARVYEEYDKQLSKTNCLDFDDLLFKTYLLFKKHPDVADYYAKKFEYVHIDEFQDTNKVQFYIAQRLASYHANLFVVGDDDQSIYGWRGANIENILSFDSLYVGAKIYKLEQNYRSTKKILELANSIIANNRGRRDKVLWTENEDGVQIEGKIAFDENEEASYAAIQIRSLMSRSDYSYKDFAVFMRVNAISRAFEQEFTKYGIPYRVFGGFKFFERKEIKDVLAYLKVINNFRDDESFIRAISTPKRGIGDKTLTELREFSAGLGLSMCEGIDCIEFSGLGNSARTKLLNFKRLLAEFKDFSKENSVAKTMEHILEVTAFKEQFTEKSEDNTSRLYNISELLNSAEQFEQANQGATLGDYLNSVTLSTDIDDINSDDAVTVATIHASKGLEYPVVFVAGLDEEIIPISRAVGNDEELEEERRLMYVAVTRAKERLYLTRAQSRYMYGQRKYMAPSRFLKEAGKVVPQFREKQKPSYEHQDSAFSSYSKYRDDDVLPANVGGFNSGYAKTFLNANKPKQNANVVSGEYKSGVKVKHVKFGEGVVIVVKGTGDNIIVDVAFKGVGVKSLSVKYAPMEIIR